MSAINPSEQKSSSPPREIPLVSIIILSYNHEKFLPRAIDSALQQTYCLKEIIVVDDGSTDHSRQIINRYGDQITPVFQENRGAASATNAGFFASRGEILFFLDSDDVFFPHKVEEMVKYYLQVISQNPDALIFHRLELTTDEGMILRLTPKKGLRTVDGKRQNGSFTKLSDPEAAYRHIQKWGFLPYISSNPSGISLTRSLARRIFPLPEEKGLFRDRLLLFGSMLLGTVYGSSDVLGSHIVHGNNVSLTGGRLFSQTDRKRITINFVNDILQKMNKDRIASFEDSRYARSYYRESGSIKGLLKLAYKVPSRCFCWQTLRFSMETLGLCLTIALGIKRGPSLISKTELYAKANKKAVNQDHRPTSVSKSELPINGTE